MPKKLPVKPSKFYGNYFIVFTVSVIVYEYGALMLAKLYFKEERNYVLLGITHLIFLMILWCFLQTVFTDPGEVPTFWGFRKGDPVSRRKRYWLICNVFKPERCHHCSNCNRWVLNMDHHWPWINNCIGFWNRKYFILLLFYVIIGIYLYVLYLGYDAFFVWKDIYLYIKQDIEEINVLKTVVILIAMLLCFMIWFLITTFFRFHLMLLFDNKTTIEWIANKHKPFKSQYDISLKHNVQQVFGK